MTKEDDNEAVIVFTVGEPSCIRCYAVREKDVKILNTSPLLFEEMAYFIEHLTPSWLPPAIQARQFSILKALGRKHTWPPED